MSTRSEQLLQAKSRLALYIQAEIAILGGAQSYSIGNRTLSRADLGDIAKMIKTLNTECLKLQRAPGMATQRVVVRDL